MSGQKVFEENLSESIVTREEGRPSSVGESRVQDAGAELGTASLSRRSFIAVGVGLAAAPYALAAGEKTVDTSPFLESLRDQREVIGRLAEGGTSARALSAQTTTVAPPYFPQPDEMTLDEVGAEKSLKLVVDYLNIDLVKNDGVIVNAKVRAYNRHVPGPTIRCNAGDRLNILLRNDLPAGEEFAYDYEGCKTTTGLGPAEAGLPHAFNTTNLHTHGLHVSPQSLCGDEVCKPPPYTRPPTLSSDDVFVSVAPGEEHKYCIILPDFHAPGTHWYHAHKHGSTSIQVNNGLVGALIIREQGDDRILGDEPHEDQIFLMQEIMEANNGNDQTVYAQTQGDTSKFFINGVYQPTLRMQTGEIQRWRFINGTSRPRGLAKLRLVKVGREELRDTSDIDLSSLHGRALEKSLPEALEEVRSANPELFERVRTFQRIASDNAQPMYLIAVDGISLYGKPPRKVLEWDFAPGNRADFLVRVDEPGDYVVVKDLHDYSGTTPEVQILARIKVDRGSAEMAMPRAIPGKPPCYLDPIKDYETRKSVDFQAVGAGNWPTVCPDVPVPWICAGGDVICGGGERPCDPGGGLPPLLPRIFAMDCARFDGDVVEAKYTMELNSVEEWTLRNFGGGAHPFHIHVNPFQVVEIFDPATGETTKFDPDEALWQDVVALPLASGGTPGHVKIRHRFLNYPGDFVIHCHFLNHEDLGMMKRVQVVPTREAQGNPPCQPVEKCVRK